MAKKPTPVAKARKDTRRLYRFEELMFRGQPLLKMKNLRSIASGIWRHSSPPGKKLPPIVAGRGDRYNGRLYSYFDGDRIVLARNERKIFVLIHELVHAMGIDHHDNKFINKYFEMLVSHHKKISAPKLMEMSLGHLA